MSDSPKNITITGESEGPSLSIAGGSYRIIISGEQTGGTYAIIEMLVPPGAGPGPHAHTEIHESFYVVDGEIEFRTAAGKYTATKGAFINIPTGGAIHAFKNKSDTTARLLCTVMPSGLEEFFQEVGRPIEAGTFLPPPVMTPEELKRIKTLAEKYGQQLYPPDYLD